jgi:hypothetical protein
LVKGQYSCSLCWLLNCIFCVEEIWQQICGSLCFLVL